MVPTTIEGFLVLLAEAFVVGFGFSFGSWLWTKLASKP